MADIRLDNRMKIATIRNAAPDNIEVANDGSLRVSGSNSVVLYKDDASSPVYDANAGVDKIVLVQYQQIVIRANKKFTAQALSSDTTIHWLPSSIGDFE